MTYLDLRDIQWHAILIAVLEVAAVTSPSRPAAAPRWGW